jgi:hypothetical protein
MVLYFVFHEINKWRLMKSYHKNIKFKSAIKHQSRYSIAFTLSMRPTGLLRHKISLNEISYE